MRNFDGRAFFPFTGGVYRIVYGVPSSSHVTVELGGYAVEVFADVPRLSRELIFR